MLDRLDRMQGLRAVLGRRGRRATSSAPGGWPGSRAPSSPGSGAARRCRSGAARGIYRALTAARAARGAREGVRFINSDCTRDVAPDPGALGPGRGHHQHAVRLAPLRPPRAPASGCGKMNACSTGSCTRSSRRWPRRSGGRPSPGSTACRDRTGDPGQQPPELRRQRGDPDRRAAAGRLPRQVRLLRGPRGQGPARQGVVRGARCAAGRPRRLQGRPSPASTRRSACSPRVARSGSTPRAPGRATGGSTAGRTGVAQLALTSGAPDRPGRPASAPTGCSRSAPTGRAWSG